MMQMMKCGLYAEMIEHNGKYVKVRFEDGTIVDSTFATYSMRRVERPIIEHEQKVTKSGRVCYLKTYHSYFNVDVIFPNGDYINHISYRDFCTNNMDDSQITSYILNAYPLHYFTYLIMSHFCNNVFYNTNGFDIYIPNMNIGINTCIKYNPPKEYSTVPGVKTFTIAEKNAKVKDTSTILRLSNNFCNLKTKNDLIQYFSSLEDSIKVLADYMGIDKNYIHITDQMMLTALGKQKRFSKYLSYIFIDQVMKQ